MKLYQILKLVQNRINPNDVLVGEFHPKGELSPIEIFNNDHFKSEEDINDYLFDRFNRTRGFAFRGELKRQLLLNLLHIDFNNKKLNRAASMEVKCTIKLLQANILIRFGMKESGIELLHELIREAEPYHFTKILKEAYDLLKNRMVLTGDVKRFEEYHSSWLKLKEIEQTEDEVHYLVSSLKLKSQKSVRQIVSNVNEVQKTLERVSVLKSKFNTPLINKLYFSLIDDYLMRKANWKESKKYADDMLENMSNDPNNYLTVSKSSVNIMKAYAHLMLGEYITGVKFIESVLKEYRGEETNYFILMEDYCILHLRLGNFDKARLIADQVLATSSFENEQVFTKERWGIYHLYAKYFNNDMDSMNPGLMSSFPEYTKDKEGFNLHILFLQILVLMKKEEYDLLFSRIEALKIYRIRQISKSGNRRAQYFMRMLFHLETYSMDYEKCKVMSNKYYNLLLQFPEKDQPYTEVELLPYEQIWQHILGILKSRSRTKAVGILSESTQVSS